VSKASNQLEEKTEGDVPTADEVIAATANEVAETVHKQRVSLEADIRQDPLRSIAVAAGAGLLAAIVARRL
jgi:hypothetical protein